MNKEDIEILERQGCCAEDWNQVKIADGCDLSRIRNVYFSGPVSIGKGTRILNVPGGLSNVRIGDDVSIVNVARIENFPSASYGIGTDVAVLDETGSRSVRIYPGISAQIAALQARMPEYAKKKLRPMIDSHISTILSDLKHCPEIGNGADIRDSGAIINVRVWPGSRIDGAARLFNGCIVNNEEENGKRDMAAVPMAYIGHGVDAENFIIEDASVSGGSLLRNTYVGQGSVLDKGFTSHDSLFFANCSMENGEACSVLAGPYSVSMHKSTLLIGCQTSFMNAGSGTNMSNHMYKHGPVHWGVLERGVKTASNSYVMHGSRIGAYSLVMGEHKSHPDTSGFPFSYLFGDGKGNTGIAPGAMLKSFGLRRDEEKWPKRERRQIPGLYFPEHQLPDVKPRDRISFRVLNPYTVNMIVDSLDLLEHLLCRASDREGVVEYKGLKIKHSSLEKGRELYRLALSKYLCNTYRHESRGTAAHPLSREWVDLAGQLINVTTLENILKYSNSVPGLETQLTYAHESFEADERLWADQYIKGHIETESISASRAEEFDALIEADRTASRDMIDKENEMLSFLKTKD